MLETIKEQYSKAKTLSKSNYYQQLHHPAGQIFSELYPLAVDYFHELNPAFLFKISRFELINKYPAITVRDGAVSFGDFIIKNFQSIPKIKTHFIIHPDLARLVPNNLRSSFSCWNIVQKNKISIKNAKRILLIGLMNVQSLPDLSEIKIQFDELKKVPSSTEIDIFLPIRSNAYGLPWKESYMGYELIEALREVLPQNKLNYLTNPELMDMTSWSGTYCLDLMSNLAIADSYMNHHMASRGASISSFKKTEDSQSIFELDMSLNHKIQILPLPEVDSLFPEMIFYKKQASTQAYYSDPRFHALLRQNNF
jgi:hypothetical protein